jgi:hypothetical protein
MSQDDKQALTQAMSEQLSGETMLLWQGLQEIMDKQVLPYWENIESGAIHLQSPMWDTPEALQALVNKLGDQTTKLLQAGHDIALHVCGTVRKGPHSPQHHQRRAMARLRQKYTKLRQRLKEIRYAHEPQSSGKNDQALVEMMSKANKSSATDTDPVALHLDPEAHLRSDLGKTLEGQIKSTLKELDLKDASYTVQEHRKLQQKLADDKQKMGNKIVTGQHQQSTRYALRVLQDGKQLLTEPQQIVDKCHRSLIDHHTFRSPDMPALDHYPWEVSGAIDKFKLESKVNAQDLKSGLHRMIQDPAEFAGLAIEQSKAVKEMINLQIRSVISKVELTDLR